MGEWQDRGMLLENHGVGKALSVLFMCRRASSLAHSANGEPALGVGLGKKWAFPGWPGSGSHPDLHHVRYHPHAHPIVGPTHPAAALSKPACLLSREDPGLLMTEESSGSPRSRRWRAGGEVIGIAGCGSRK